MEYKELQKKAYKYRLGALTAINAAKSGHIGGSLSIAEIMAVLYNKHMRFDCSNPHWSNRDRFVLSKGHASAIYYAVLADCGFFDEKELLYFRNINGFLQGHPSMLKTPGVDMSTGSLGQGLSCANGMALAAKIDGLDFRVYCICGDGEMNEGQIWEAMMTSSHYNLSNLTMILDLNGLQIDGKTEEVKNSCSLVDKIKSFGWETIEIDGHNVVSIDKALDEAKKITEKPTAVICQTIKGKGVSFMENQAGWHGTPPTDEQYIIAHQELKQAMEKFK